MTQINKTSSNLEQSLDTIDIKVEDVIPLYHSKKEKTPPSKLKLIYDVLMLVIIIVDLLLIFFDKVVMSLFFEKIATWLTFETWLANYKIDIHPVMSTLAGFFTLFLIVELLIRWVRAIYKKTYYRWFFFPFVHWYEVLGCFPMLRPLRLLRAVVLIKRLHELDVHVIPENWIKTALFYWHILLEELSDRVILVAVDNFRAQMAQSTTHHGLIQNTIDKNRAELEKVILSVLRHELVPKLQHNLLENLNDVLVIQIGQTVEHSLSNAPELRKYLRLIPIAGGMIEAQVASIGKHIGEEITKVVTRQLLSESGLDMLMQNIAKGVSEIDTTRPELHKLVADIVEDGLNAFEAQIKVQQWKHRQQVSLP